jgi:Xaa-Pro aminopeptidase
VFLDIMHSFNGYRTCYYRTFICGVPNKHQIDAYETASKWISASIDLIRPGITPDQVAEAWPDAQEFGYRDEAEAFLLQYGHGVGLSLWERPIISKRYTGRTRRSRKAWCSRWRPGRAPRTAPARLASKRRSW